MDSLTELVRMLSPAGTVDLHCRFAGNWRVDNAAAPAGHLPYHIILKGQARALVEQEAISLRAGDVLLFPHGSAHTLRSLPDDAGGADARTPAQATRFNGLLTEVTIPGDTHPLDMLCGTFVLGLPGTMLLRNLPPVLRVATAQRADCAWLEALIGMMRNEAQAPEPGGTAVIGQLSTALLTLLLRALIAQGGVTHSVLALMADARLAKSIDAVLRAPAEPWSVASLAAVCNVSRATFARRFSQLSGETPLQFVTTLRMEMAARLLTQDRESAASIGEHCGYASEAAFGRAFKAYFGVGPGSFRRAARERRSAAAAAMATGAVKDQEEEEEEDDQDETAG
ncbi:putative AraC-type DNA-binding transcriptional regulator [Cupriavidus basilensis OR16]|uniref:Putative AraC-type DNA-binding transcriptional regulator n=1 Tax=Cupriavidus basilensis OR16 TaxID=1127483 RepID=H1RZE2_9BURK|nr:AraC family transcriptional regulator [Cupriavidus basilensis]EHP44284.1 putative AraC-type DNA-binding transcriptional regulator [Cupriavidus basilensis OR16]